MTAVEDLNDYAVTFTMRAGDAERTFTFVVPGEDRVSAFDCAYQIAAAINESSGHAWKIPAEFGVGDVVTRQDIS